MESLGSALKTIRQENKVSKKNLAEGICSVEKLTKIEDNSVFPDLFLLNQFCERLTVSIDDVFQKYQSIDEDNKKKINLMTYYFQSSQFEKLDKACQHLAKENAPLSNEDAQMFFFFQGQSELLRSKNYPKALESFRTALSYSYELRKKVPSDMEVLLLNEIGFTYYLLGDHEKTEYFLEKSMRMFFTFQRLDFRIEMIKVLYNTSQICLSNGKIEEAMKLVDLGLSWCHKKMTLYLLNEFLYLKAIILEETGRLSEAVYYVDTAEQLKGLELADL